MNCGTGEDALWLVKQGCEVTATDASSKMIEVCKNKTNSKPSTLNPKFSVAKFNEIKSKQEGQKFDLIFSNFGGLNCVDAVELKLVLNDFSSLLNPNGRMVFVIMGRKCIWERIYFLMKLNFKGAFRRISRQPVPAHVLEGSMQNTFYFSPHEVVESAGEKLKHISTKPIGLFIPPPYLEKFFSNKKVLLGILNRLEKMIGKFSFLSDYADHYLIAFEKR